MMQQFMWQPKVWQVATFLDTGKFLRCILSRNGQVQTHFSMMLSVIAIPVWRAAPCKQTHTLSPSAICDTGIACHWSSPSAALPSPFPVHRRSSKNMMHGGEGKALQLQAASLILLWLVYGSLLRQRCSAACRLVKVPAWANQPHSLCVLQQDGVSETICSLCLHKHLHSIRVRAGMQPSSMQDTPGLPSNTMHQRMGLLE